MKKYTAPIAIIMTLALLVRFLETVFYGHMSFVVTIIRAMLLFYFGIVLSKSRRRSQTWVKKVVVIFIFALLIVVEMGVFEMPDVYRLMETLGIYGNIIYLIYIYCGYLFFD
jgi:uncharacterized membrane protein YGL010W